MDIRDPNEKQVVLGESLRYVPHLVLCSAYLMKVRLFTRAARVIEFEKLREICGDYQHLNYAKGGLNLTYSPRTIHNTS